MVDPAAGIVAGVWKEIIPLDEVSTVIMTGAKAAKRVESVEEKFTR
jgi:hypothetical protein